MAILHVASIAAHTTLNTYKPMEINIERSPQHWMSKQGSNSEKFSHENNDASTARPQLQEALVAKTNIKDREDKFLIKNIFTT